MLKNTKNDKNTFKVKANSTAKHPLRHAKRIVGIGLTIAVVAVGSYFGSFILEYYKQSAALTHATHMRELVTASMPGEATPVDFKTGDIYFSEAKLYLPKPAGLHSRSITYTLYPQSQPGQPAVASEDEEWTLSVSSRQTQELAMQAMRNARTVEQVFDAVPKLQACSRGVTLVYDKSNPAVSEGDAQNEFKQTVRLDSGKDLHIYTNKACPESNSLTAALLGIKSY